MHTVDYVGATEAARTAINDWTAEHTEDRIIDIIPGDTLDDGTRLVLVNALYLKAPWEEEFDKPATQPKPFTLADDSSVDVPTMSMSLEGASYARGEDWRIVQVPYAGRDLAMTIVLPDEGRLADLERAVADGGLPATLAAPKPTGVDLHVPRWTLRTTVSLGEPLAGLGMPTAFTDAADLSGMTTDEPLQIAAVLHQVFVAVDEEGTEAAAATAVVNRTLSARVGGVTVHVDRPFLFVIHDTAHGTPLFLGRVSDPRG